MLWTNLKLWNNDSGNSAIDVFLRTKWSVGEVTPWNRNTFELARDQRQRELTYTQNILGQIIETFARDCDAAQFPWQRTKHFFVQIRCNDWMWTHQWRVNDIRWGQSRCDSWWNRCMNPKWAQIVQTVNQTRNVKIVDTRIWRHMQCLQWWRGAQCASL